MKNDDDELRFAAAASAAPAAAGAAATAAAAAAAESVGLSMLCRGGVSRMGVPFWYQGCYGSSNPVQGSRLIRLYQLLVFEI